MSIKIKTRLELTENKSKKKYKQKRGKIRSKMINKKMGQKNVNKIFMKQYYLDKLKTDKL